MSQDNKTKNLLPSIYDPKIAKLSSFGNNTVAPSSIRKGLILVFLFFGIFGSFAAFYPLQGSAVATGKVVPDTKRKTIQHLEGGIIDEILISEGDYVEEGQPLIVLSETNAKARLNLLLDQYYTSKITEARLIAERDGEDSITFASEILDRAINDDATREVIDVQTRIFETRKESVFGQINILNQREKQLNDEIKGLRSQLRSTSNQLALIYSEIKTVKQLLASGSARKPRLLELQRNAQGLQGRKGEISSDIAKAKQSITETQIEIYNLKNRSLNTIVSELNQTQLQLSTLAENLRSAEDVMQRLVITSPQSGYVTALKVFTKGGVIRPGQEVMDIVPDRDKLVIECQISPKDRDIVYEGLEAQVKLTAYNARYSNSLEGRLTSVSADSIIDEASKVSYYLGRIEVPSEEFTKHGYDIKPGMQANVFIITDERTLLSYLLSPLSQSLNKAFRD